jgi:putative spermidine/putrescine transport system permease protein
VTALRVFVGLTYLFVLAPAVVVVGSAFSSEQLIAFPPEGFSLRWFDDLFSQPDFGYALGLSFELAIVATLGSLAIGLPAAYALARRETRVTRSTYYLLLSPVLVPHLLLGFGLLYGYVQLGVPIGFWALVPAHVLITLPFVVTILLQSMRRIDRRPELAAASLGAGPWEVFWHATLPALRPGIVAAASVSMLLSFDQLPASLLLKDIGTGTLPVYLYNLVQYDVSPTLSALSTVIVAINLVLLVVASVGLSRIRRRPARVA